MKKAPGQHCAGRSDYPSVYAWRMPDKQKIQVGDPETRPPVIIATHTHAPVDLGQYERVQTAIEL